MKRGYFLIIFLVTIFLYGCNSFDNPKNSEIIKQLETVKAEQATKIAELENNLKESKTKIESLMNEIEALKGITSSTKLINRSMAVLQAMKDEDMAALAGYVHPTLGLRFSPYCYVETATDLKFNATSLSSLLSDSTEYTWGNYDGSGEPINLKFSEYLRKFVYDEDYINPELIGINQFIGTGNTINNVETAYPSASFVEFHFRGLYPEYGGSDWASLILVFEDYNGDLKLVGVVHNQWTI